MNFRHDGGPTEPEINLIPLIDVLMVILIFLAASTSFVHQRQLDIALPQAQAEVPTPESVISLAISRDGQYALDGNYVDAGSDQALAGALQQAAAQKPDEPLRIDADAQTTHAAVVRALEAARLAGIKRVHFLTQAQP